MPDELKIPVTTPGADKAKRDLRGVANAEKQVGQAGKQGGEEAAEGAERASGATNKLGSSIAAVIGGYVGLRGALRILDQMRQQTERVDEATRSAVESLRAIMALSALQGERKETREAVMQMAVGAGRKLEEVAPAYYTLLGGTSTMSRERQKGLMGQVLTMGKTDPSASLDSLVNLFTTIASQQPDMAPTQIGNLISKTIEQAKSTPEEMAQYLPAVLSAAKAGGVPVATTAAMFSFSTRRGGGVATSGTAVRSALMGLLAPADDVAKQLAKLGFPGDGDLTSRVMWLADNAQRLPPELMASLGGRRGIEAIAAIAGAPQEFAAERQLMAGAMSAPGSLLEDRLRGMYGEAPAQRYLDQLNQLEVMTSLQDVSPAETGEKAKLELRKWFQKGGTDSAFWRWVDEQINKKTRDATGKLPAMPETSIIGAMERLLDEGYAPADMQAAFGDELHGEIKTIPRDELVDELRQRLTASGAEPMQGGQTVVNNNGCTIYNFDGGVDPAGKVQPAAAQGF